MKRFLALAFLFLFSACEGPPTGPADTSDLLLLATHSSTHLGECPTVDFVASDEATLRAALSSALPGAVIGLDGFFPVARDIRVTTANVTLTCATPGSGLFAFPPFSPFFLISARAPGVRVERLVLDGGLARRGPLNALNNGATALARDVRFLDNTATCGRQNCVLVNGAAEVRIEGNHFQSAGSGSGVHLQGNGPLAADGSRPRPIDGALVKNNTIVATAPSFNLSFGGIRARDGADVVVEKNTVLGPWANSISVANLSGSTFERNRLEGAAQWGVAAFFTAGRPGVLLRDTQFRENTIVVSAHGAIFVAVACHNVFRANGLLSDNLVNFHPTTGANTLERTPNADVADFGALDCDGDGVSDPNIILDLVVPTVLQPSDLCSDHAPSDIGTFEDANLEMAVRLILGVGELADLTCGLLAGMPGLAGHGGIVSLVGIQNLTSLTSLLVFVNSITDISPLSGLTGLTDLDVSFNSVTDLSALSGLSGLTDLRLIGNPDLSDIQPLLDNTGLGTGDMVDLRLTSVSCADIAALQAKGVTVTSDCP